MIIDIEKLIKSETNDGTDKPYETQLRIVYEKYKDTPYYDVVDNLAKARREYRISGPTHKATAECTVLAEMLRYHI